MRWQVTGASEPGTSHLKDGRSCEDAHASWSDDSAGVLVLAVADGAGSASHGAEAARIAVDVVVEACRHRFTHVHRGRVDTPQRWEALLQYVVHAVRYELERRATDRSSAEASATRGSDDDRGTPLAVAPGHALSDRSHSSGAPSPSTADESRDAQVRSPAPGSVAHALELIELEVFTTGNEGASDSRRPSTGASFRDAEGASDDGDASTDAASVPVGGEPRDAQPGPPASLNSFATTLLAAIVTERWLACVQIGDGVIVVRRDGALEALTRPAKGEYANQTDFVTADRYSEATQSRVLCDHGADAIALMSDGLERLAIELSTNTPHAAFFRNLFAFAESRDLDHDQRQAALSQELRSDKVNRLTDDDKTLLVAVRPDGQALRSTGT